MDIDPTPPEPSSAIRDAPALPIAARTRARLALAGDTAFTGGLDTLLTDLSVVRRLALRLDDAGDATVRAGHLHAFGLLHQYQRRLLIVLSSSEHAGLTRALNWLTEHFGRERVDIMLRSFLDAYAPAATPARSRRTPAAADAPSPAPGPRELVSENDSEAPDEATILGQLVLLWLANDNPVTRPFRALFDDREIEARSGYRAMIASLGGFFAAQDAATSALFEALGAPVRAAPQSPDGQLDAVLAARRAGVGVPVAAAAQDASQRGLLRGLDVLREEDKIGFLPGPPPPPEVPDFAALAGGSARYSQEAGWMRALVLVAKNVLVWLDQLATETGGEVGRLDQVPEFELERLRRYGFTGLWLIGIWTRSPASARIKQLCGNPEAAASAYAVDEYRIDPQLGGDEALDVLALRAARHGIRLACDMVPNHMGIDSRWVIEHPERFVQVATPPFPGYSFAHGPDLSPDPRVSLHLEDGYYDRRDAAVVFRRTEPRTDSTTYIYHGNDGTSLPWNDTAQLDFLRQETRQAVLDTILQVARRFPIIRFDAAMTLARQHVQRLWHPLPGTGGDIPSRAEHALDQASFDAGLPGEVWREVVDRMAVEAPGTLLLAEAFWLMESYFVRSLGMHRVYNSAFMHMLREGDNARFHRYLAEALAFDPGLVARFVSFATNPDEAPAAAQLGTGDRYFAVATLLAVLPGTPLFGHGQVEGLEEQYGMEYRRAYREQPANPALIARHMREIAPLLARRALFAGADAFELYLVQAEGGDGEDVIAISNRCGGARALVLVHNGDATVRGRLRQTVPRPRGEQAAPAALSLARALGVAPGERLCGRDLLAGHDVTFDGQRLASEGLAFVLGPYERMVLVDLIPSSPETPPRKEPRSTGTQAAGAGIAQALEVLLEPALIGRLLDLRPPPLADEAVEDRAAPASRRDDATREALRRSALLAVQINAPKTRVPPAEQIQQVEQVEQVEQVQQAAAGLEAFVALMAEREQADTLDPPNLHPSQTQPEDRGRWLALLAWTLAHPLVPPAPRSEPQQPRQVAWIGAFRHALAGLLAAFGTPATLSRRHQAAATLWLRRPRWYQHTSTAAELLCSLEDDADARVLLGRHRHNSVAWIEREGLAALCWWLVMSARLGTASMPEVERSSLIRRALGIARELSDAERASGYRWRALRRRVETSIEAGIEAAENTSIDGRDAGPSHHFETVAPVPQDQSAEDTPPA